jgi:hypothetical protein
MRKKSKPDTILREELSKAASSSGYDRLKTAS